MEVIITPQAKKLIKKLPKITQIAVIEKLKQIEKKGSVGITKLSGYKNSFRVRVGDYRIVYKILKGKIYVALVGHRKDVYLLVKRLFGR